MDGYTGNTFAGHPTQFDRAISGSGSKGLGSVNAVNYSIRLMNQHLECKHEPVNCTILSFVSGSASDPVTSDDDDSATIASLPSPSPRILSYLDSEDGLRSPLCMKRSRSETENDGVMSLGSPVSPVVTSDSGIAKRTCR
eukprot:Rmarinus@m.15226